jgi:hypothetical protein
MKQSWSWPPRPRRRHEATSSDVTVSSATTDAAAPTARAVCPKPRSTTDRLLCPRPGPSTTPSARRVNVPNAERLLIGLVLSWLALMVIAAILAVFVVGVFVTAALGQRT